jgi:hypothetical protein
VRAVGLLVVFGLAAPACLITNAPPDGAWSPTDRPCVSAGATPRRLASDSQLDHVVLGGDTVLYNSTGAIKQVRVPGGEPEIVALAYNDGPFEVFDNSLIYVAAEDHGASVVIDRGLRATPRWESIGPSQTSGVHGLLAISAGVYWSHDPTRPGFRWNPTDGLTQFDLRAYSPTGVEYAWIETDGTTFFYSIDGTILVTKPVTGGFAVEINRDFNSRPLAIDAADVFYTRFDPEGLGRELVALSRSDGTLRVLVRGNISDGALGGGYVYWLDGTSPHILRRVAVAGGASEIVMTSPTFGRIRQILVDACNVYWTEEAQDSLNHATPDGVTLHARSH